MSGTNAIYYATKDNIDSTAVITDSKGVQAVAEKFSALGWGENNPQAIIASITRHEFTGQEMLNNLGMVNLNARVYQPSGGRFYSPDPKIPDSQNTLDYNRYAYVDDNPLTLIDPTGFDADCSAADCDGGGGSQDNLAPSYPSVQLQQVNVYGTRISDISDLVAYIDWQSSQLQRTLNSPFSGHGFSMQLTSQRQQSDPRPQQTCPNGKLAQYARAAVNMGNAAVDEGGQFMKTGATGMIMSAPALETPVGDAFFAASAFVARMGSFAAGGGLILKTAGAAILFAEGDSQPLQSAGLQLAQSHFEDNIGLPPLPFPDPLDSPIEGLAGEDACP